ncbi:MAG: hypothetical protein IKN31_01140 [Bacteroidales bacterium]|nr:hypothetical protein [Bacteroidales bacterium]
MTILTIILIVILVFGLNQTYKETQVLTKSRESLIAKRKRSYKVGIRRLVSYGIILGVGIYLYATKEITKTVTENIWLIGEVTNTMWTANHYWAFLCVFVGSIGTLLGLIKTVGNYSEYTMFSRMTDFEYQQKRAEIRNKQAEELRQVKQARRSQKIGEVIGRLLYG